MRLAHAGLVARADRPDAVALDDRRALGHSDGAQVGERDRPAVGGLDRHALAVGRDRAGERDDASGRRAHAAPTGPGDVDAAVEARRLRLLGVEGERLQDRAVGRPRPGARGRDAATTHEREQEPPREHEPPSSSRGRGDTPLSCRRDRRRAPRPAPGQLGERLFATVRRVRAGCQRCRRGCHRFVTKSRGRGRFGTPVEARDDVGGDAAAAFRPRRARPRPRPPPSVDGAAPTPAAPRPRSRA